MYQKDFILRMIEMLAEMIAGILGLIKKGDYQKASNSLDNAYQDLLKQDSGFFNSIPIDDLTDKLLKEHNYTCGHLEILSELFYAEAELYFARGNQNESLQFYTKSLLLLEYVIKESNTFSFEKHLKVSHIKKRIVELNNAII